MRAVQKTMSGGQDGHDAETSNRQDFVGGPDGGTIRAKLGRVLDAM